MEGALRVKLVAHTALSHRAPACPFAPDCARKPYIQACNCAASPKHLQQYDERRRALMNIAHVCPTKSARGGGRPAGHDRHRIWRQR